MNYNFINIMLDFIITITSYLIVPFILFYKPNKNYNKTEKKKILVLNSIIIAIIFIIIRIIQHDPQPVKTFAPSLFYYYINKLIWLNNRTTYNIKKSKMKKEKIYLIMISVIIITIVSLFTIFLINKNKIIEEQKEKLNELTRSSKDCQQEKNVLMKKSSFVDEYIVFELEELSGNYLSYNCMLYLVNGKKYTFQAYNIKQAQSKGLKEYKCPIRIELGLENN